VSGKMQWVKFSANCCKFVLKCKLTLQLIFKCNSHCTKLISNYIKEIILYQIISMTKTFEGVALSPQAMGLPHSESVEKE